MLRAWQVVSGHGLGLTRLNVSAEKTRMTPVGGSAGWQPAAGVIWGTLLALALLEIWELCWARLSRWQASFLVAGSGRAGGRPSGPLA